MPLPSTEKILWILPVTIVATTEEQFSVYEDFFLSPRVWHYVGFSSWLCISSWNVMGIYVYWSPISPPRGARDETVLSWNVPLKCSGGTTHSGRYHWKSACDNTEGALTPHRTSTTVPSGGTHGATGSNRILSTQSFRRIWILVDTDIKLQLSLSLFQLHTFFSTWSRPRCGWPLSERLPKLALPELEYTRKSSYFRAPSSPAQFPLAACLRQALRSRSWNSGLEACLYHCTCVRLRSFSECAIFLRILPLFPKGLNRCLG